MPKIFSIIVTYNGSAWIEKCLNHLFESDIKSDVIIIDNASTDNTLQLLEKYKDFIHLIKNKKNTGFGQANNVGIIYAMNKGADFIFLLNQDAYIFNGTIHLLTECLQKNKDFGILSPLQLEVTGKSIEPIFRNFLLNNFSEKTAEKMLTGQDNFPVDKPYSMRFVNAAAWMISRDCINKTGLFHPVFFHYGEDNHYSSRVQYHGLKIGVLPTAWVIHDCKKDAPDSHSLLLRKIKVNPIYTLLDLRKPLPLAYLLGYLKWRRLAKELSKYTDANTKTIIEEHRKWFSVNFSKAIQIRKETKKPANFDL
jgi:GT2 family glycosyltransferase